jgi:hypothetical protein
MPTSARPTGDIKVQFYDQIDNEYYLVDESVQTNLLTATPGDLSEIQVIPNTNLTYYLDNISVRFVTAN